MSNDKLLRLRGDVQITNDALCDNSLGWLLMKIDQLLAEPEPAAIVSDDKLRRLRKATSLGEIDRLLAEPEPATDPSPTDPERAIIGWVADNCGLTVAQEAELARRLESLRQPAPPLTGPNYLDQEEWGHAPAPATDAETQQELADLHAELDEVRDERDEARAELARLRAELDQTWEATGVAGAIRGLKTLADVVRLRRRDLIAANEELARLRAGGCARDQTTTQWCAEAVALQRENERLRAYEERTEHGLVGLSLKISEQDFFGYGLVVEQSATATRRVRDMMRDDMEKRGLWREVPRLTGGS